MKMKPSRAFLPLLLVLKLSLLAGCGAAQMGRGLTANGNRVEGEKKAEGREVALGERFKLDRDEKVWVKDTKLTVQLKGVRRSWLANGKGEFVDAEIIFTLDAKEETHWLKLGEKLTVGDYVIELKGAYPFGKTNAELMITRK
ncbi:MAG TPA: hypothetical protein VF791_13275 [Pyrinomonadaceae bacterium]